MAQPITAFDKPTLRALRPEIEALLAPLADRGVRVRLGNGRFDATTADFRLELVVDRPATPDGTVRESKEATAFRRLAYAYGFHPDDLGKAFPYEGTTFRLVGCRPAAPKRPIIIESLAGKRYVCGPEMVLGLLARAAA